MCDAALSPSDARGRVELSISVQSAALEVVSVPQLTVSVLQSSSSDLRKDIPIPHLSEDPEGNFHCELETLGRRQFSVTIKVPFRDSELEFDKLLNVP